MYRACPFFYSIRELCDSWQAGWQLASWVAVGKLWQLAICIPLASCVAVGKLYTAGELYIAGELCGRWQAVWQFGVWAVFGGRGVCWPECQNRPPQRGARDRRSGAAHNNTCVQAQDRFPLTVAFFHAQPRSREERLGTSGGAKDLDSSDL
jgi:hypothetical protein